MTKFQDELKVKMDAYVKGVYRVTKSFPKDELYGVTSQFRRAALSVILNYIEGFARFKPGYKQQFFENAYASLKESKYLVYFSYTEKYIDKKEYDQLLALSEEIGKMVWSEMEFVKSSAQQSS